MNFGSKLTIYLFETVESFFCEQDAVRVSTNVSEILLVGGFNPSENISHIGYLPEIRCRLDMLHSCKKLLKATLTSLFDNQVMRELRRW